MTTIKKIIKNLDCTEKDEENNTTKIVIECEIQDEYLDDFLTFLRRAQYDGIIGHSEWLSIFVDGDGRFRPKFTIYDKDLDRRFQGTDFLINGEKKMENLKIGE